MHVGWTVMDATTVTPGERRLHEEICGLRGEVRATEDALRRDIQELGARFDRELSAQRLEFLRWLVILSATEAAVIAAATLLALSTATR